MSPSSPTFHWSDLGTVKLVKKLLGENEVEAVLQRLGRLTDDEARTTAAQTLEVVCGLVQNIRVVMDGEKMHYAYPLLTVYRHSF